jgi:UPF0042 nucleotide-binding protein
MNNKQLLIVTGLSGSGKSQCAGILEDMGYFVVDNLPPNLINSLLEECEIISDKKPLAVVVDVRSGEFLSDIYKTLEDKNSKVTYKILFLECNEQTLLSRFEHVRRPHPLSTTGIVSEGIKNEIKLLEPLKQKSDYIVDTSELNIHELTDSLNNLLSDNNEESGITINVVSFGFKYGFFKDANFLIDVRFLPNPFWDNDLKQFNGYNTDVQNYVKQDGLADKFVAEYIKSLQIAIDSFDGHSRKIFNIGVGCTGGKHRSVTVANMISDKLLEKKYKVNRLDRDIDND